MYIRWNRRQLRSNRQLGEFLCPHLEVTRPWTIAPILVHKWPDGAIRTVWNPGPNIRECCIAEGQGLALAAWWWEARNRFEDLHRDGLEDKEITQALIEQLDYIEEILEERIPKPTKRDWKGYLAYRDDLGLTKRRVRTPFFIRRLGLPWPFTKDDLSKRWVEIARRQHPDHGGDTAVFRDYLKAYKAARLALEQRSV